MAAAKKLELRARLVKCPRCKESFMFRRPKSLRFDHHGFESYSLCCEYCRTFLIGIVDPFDGTLLVSTE